MSQRTPRESLGRKILYRTDRQTQHPVQPKGTFPEAAPSATGQPKASTSGQTWHPQDSKRPKSARRQTPRDVALSQDDPAQGGKKPGHHGHVPPGQISKSRALPLATQAHLPSI